MMQKFTITDLAGNPLRVVFIPADEIENQLSEGEQAREYQEGDLPPVSVLPEEEEA